MNVITLDKNLQIHKESVYKESVSNTNVCYLSIAIIIIF